MVPIDGWAKGTMIPVKDPALPRIGTATTGPARAGGPADGSLPAVADPSTIPSGSMYLDACLDPYRESRDPQARLSLAVERARQRPPLPAELRRDEFLVPGCQVRLWLVPGFVDGRCRYATDSDAATLKALTGLLADVYNGRTPEEVLACPPDFLEDLGLLRQLAESRRATVLRVAQLIRDHAAACRTPGRG